METRSDALRRRSRRIFAWSFGVAVCLHAAVLLLWPEIPLDPYVGAFASQEPDTVQDDLRRVPVEAKFGPPLILSDGGRWIEEPPDRVLEAVRAVHLADSCLAGEPTVAGRVRMQVNPEGRVDLLWIVESSGSTCGDSGLRSVAGDLWYRWLPSERFPAPVNLIQPVSLTLLAAGA